MKCVYYTNMLNMLNMYNMCISTKPGAYLCPGKNMQNMQNIFCSIAYFAYFAYLLIYDAQNKALLDTLRLKKSNTTQGHICPYSTLLIEHTKHRGVMRISSWPFVPKKLQLSNRQDYVFMTVHPAARHL
jgi:hypothetical protein